MSEEKRAMKRNTWQSGRWAAAAWRSLTSGLRSRAIGTTVATAVLAMILGTPAGAVVTHHLEGAFNGSEAPNGQFRPIFADATDNSGGPSAGDVYIASFTRIGKLHPDGTYAGVEISGAETPQESFSLVSEESVSGALAVDGSSGANSGDLYVADMEHGVVDRFDESGKFICQITGRAKPSTAECAGATGSATLDGGFEPAGLAVDGTSGDLWVADRAHAAVDEFNAAGEYVSQIKNSHIVSPGPIALDSGGYLYVVNGTTIFGNTSSNNVVVFHEGTFTRVLDEHEPLSVAVDPATSHAYVFEVGNKTIAEYDSIGSLVDTFWQRVAGEPSMPSLAVSSDGHIYGAELFAGRLAKYSPLITIPTVTTEAATAITETGAVLHGHVDPDTSHGGGAITVCEFEYVTKEAFELHGFEGATHEACEPAAPYAAAQAVSAAVSLSPSTAYEFRVNAANANEVVSVGSAVALATTGPPVVTSEESSTLSVNSASLGAVVSASGFETSCVLEYVEQATFAISGYTDAAKAPCSPATVPSTATGEPVTASLTGLGLSTVYHYRFVAKNSAGTTDGTDKTFATFGIKAFSFEAVDREGRPYTQAGGHPYEWTSSFEMNTTLTRELFTKTEAADTNIRNLETELPAGFIVNATATPRCPRYLVALEQCSPASQVGVIEITDADNERFIEGIYNVVPPKGVPVELGAVVANLVRVYIDGNVRTDGDYGATAKVMSASAEDNIRSSRISIWGVPEDPTHNARRVCPIPGEQVPVGREPCPSSGPEVPFLTNPTSCSGTSLIAKMRVDSWQSPGAYVSASTELPAITGCKALDFTPSITIKPDTTVADSPSGLDVNLEVPQNESPSGLASSALKDTSVQLPVGVAVSASAANGLEACSEEQVALHSEKPSECPNGSKIGTVEVVSPLLADHLTGGVYVARQNENPFHSLLAMYVVAEADGARVKLAGHVAPDPVTGQLTTTFEETPQLPFSDFKLKLFGGRRGTLATPESCGTLTSTVSLSPWSGLQETILKPSFVIDTDCVNGFKPSLSAGAVNTTAGAYTPFTLSLARADSEEEVTGLAVKLPPGLLAKIAGVTQCTDAQAASDSCPASSQIGTVQTSVGPGGSPLSLPGRMYFTGPYEGAPYGEEVVVPAVAGPFNLGDVVVRGKIQVDPLTAQPTVTSDPFPTIVQGIPTRLRRIDVTVDRPDFTFNPTSCEPLTVNAAATSLGGAVQQLHSRFQVGACGELRFKPKFSVSTSAKTSRRNGASLRVKLVYPQGPFGSQANVKSVHVELPKALPSRLSTLNHACLESVFNRNPVECPSQSRVGYAKATTPVVPVPLEGPAYFVSHGGQKFPELVMVLQGYGITVELPGETFISKAGITSSTFKQVPDVPVSSFELNLPEGPFSALGANQDLCRAKLTMPTTIVGQNGATVRQATRIAVSGCKPAIHVVRHSVKGSTVTLVVNTPSAGRLTAQGAGLTSIRRSVRAGNVTIALTLTKSEQAILRRHPGRRLRTKIKLSLAPKHGPKVASSVTVLVG